jgi:hypothetical protein
MDSNYIVTPKQFKTLYTIAETMLESGSSDARMGGRMVLDILIDVEVTYQKQIVEADRYWDKVADQYDRDIAAQSFANSVESTPISLQAVDAMMTKLWGK